MTRIDKDSHHERPGRVLILPRSKASYHIGGLTERLVKETLDSLRREYRFTYDYSSDFDGSGGFTKGGPDFSIPRVDVGPIEIEVKQRKRGYTMRPEFDKWVAKFQGSSKKIVIFFSNYGPRQRRFIRRWCAEADIVLVELPAIPCSRTGDGDFVFNSRSERRWFARAASGCLKDLGWVLRPMLERGVRHE